MEHSVDVGIEATSLRPQCRYETIRRDLLEGILYVGNASVEVGRIKRVKTGVVCIKVMVQGKGGDESTEG